MVRHEYLYANAADAGSALASTPSTGAGWASPLRLPLLAFFLAQLVSGCQCAKDTSTARPRIEAVPASLDFGSTAPGLPLERFVTLRNPGAATLAISEATVAGPAAASFVADLLSVSQVEAGGSFSLRVVYTPRTLGSHSAWLSVRSDAANAPELLIPLSGTGLAEDLCAKVTCNQPPAAICVNASTRRGYSPTGTCSSGTCTYPSADAACAAAEICLSGQCKWNDPSLASLMLTPGSLAFSPSQLAYAVSVPPGTTRVAVTATVSQPARVVLRVNGSVTNSGATATVAMSGPATSIEVRVDAESGATRNYTVVVTTGVASSASRRLLGG
ncbi:MAG: choice-of-anchor D domain-containing protein [Myxococcaceae bacterium]